MSPMELLYFFEKLRNPLLDGFFLAVTQFGDEILFIAIALMIFWCVDKTTGYYLMSVCFFGVVLNQTLKIAMQVPRPWVIDPSFTIVEAARDAASGYSFPSGHTQNGVSIFGCLFASAPTLFGRHTKTTVFRIICVVFAILVPVSRMYLGVHTPADISVSAIIAIFTVVLFRFLFKAAEKKPVILYIIIAFMVIFATAYLLYAGTFDASADENIATGYKHGWYMLGAVTAIAISYPFEKKFVRFETKASLPGHILKLALGVAVVVGIKSALKQPLYSLFGGHYAADAVRYFAMVFFAVCIWPLTFKLFSKTKKEENV